MLLLRNNRLFLTSCLLSTLLFLTSKTITYSVCLRHCSFAELSFAEFSFFNITQHNKNKQIQLSALLTTFNLLLSCTQLTLLIQRTAQVCLDSLCASGHRQVLEYSLGYSSSTRVTNYSVSTALRTCPE